MRNSRMATPALLRRVAALVLISFLSPLLTAAESSAGPTWLRDDRAAFARASAEKRFVLLYLEATWCHWCHVMERETYTDEAVRTAIDAHYVPLRIDQDARPDLANRYRDYGWPATIVFAADGSEIVKRRGFIEAAAFARLLDAIVADPSPERLASVETQVLRANPTALDPETRAELARRHRDTYDTRRGGLDTNQKFLDRDSVEYALTLGLAGDADELARAHQTLDAATALIDPVWGGVYQYSTGGDWNHPHFEKLTVLQGEYLRLYALGYAATGDVHYRGAAEALIRYIDGFLSSPDGGFYASQDADLVPGQHSAEFFALDDKARRTQGVPRIDRNRYARETAAVATGLLAWHDASADPGAKQRALTALKFLRRERRLPQGGYRHGAADTAGPYLGDSLDAGNAALAAYRSTGERSWLDEASASARFIEANFRSAGGYASAVVGKTPIAPVPQIDENIKLARYANLLFRYSGDQSHRAIAAHALAWLARPSVALDRLTEAGVLLADREFNADPLHLTVIGAKDDAAAAALYDAALSVASSYKRLDWWDRAEGPLPNADVEYPRLKRAAAFVCNEQRCSLPIYAPEAIAEFLAER
jgi:uncharacterized protein YyaL (SSP411 family)